MPLPVDGAGLAVVFQSTLAMSHRTLDSSTWKGATTSARTFGTRIGRGTKRVAVAICM